MNAVVVTKKEHLGNNKERKKIIAKSKKYHFYEDYPIVIPNKDFMFQWCCDCGLRHINFVEIERGKKPKEDKVKLFVIRDDHATNYRKDYERLKKREVKIMSKHTKKERKKKSRKKDKKK